MTRIKQRHRKRLHRYLALRYLGSQEIHLLLQYSGSQEVHPLLRYLVLQLPSSLPEFFSLAVSKARCSSRTRHSHLLVVAWSFRVGTSRWAARVVVTSPAGGSSRPKGHKGRNKLLCSVVHCMVGSLDGALFGNILCFSSGLEPAETEDDS